MLRALLPCLCLVLLAASRPAAACNPNPPRHPILQGNGWDATAAEYLLRDATSVAAARLTLRLDLEVEGQGGPGTRSDYVFEVLEGWKAHTPRRVTLAGRWVPCDLGLSTGRVFMLYLEGERLLHAVPVEALDFELAPLGEPDWFYDATGRLVFTEEE
ncbi:MAG: hypothetical protein ACNA8G_08125 [Gammaproteobacteria bacterium]